MLVDHWRRPGRHVWQQQQKAEQPGPGTEHEQNRTSLAIAGEEYLNIDSADRPGQRPNRMTSKAGAKRKNEKEENCRVFIRVGHVGCIYRGEPFVLVAMQTRNNGRNESCEDLS